MQNALPILDFEFMQCLVCYYDVGVAAREAEQQQQQQQLISVFCVHSRPKIKKLFRTQSLRSRVKAMPGTGTGRGSSWLELGLGWVGCNAAHCVCMHCNAVAFLPCRVELSRVESSRAWDEPACNLSLWLILCCISHFALPVVAAVVGLLSLAMCWQHKHRIEHPACSSILPHLPAPIALLSLDWLSVGLSVVGFWLPSLAFVVIAMFLTNSQGNAHGCLFIVPCMRFTFIFNLCRQLLSRSHTRTRYCCRHPLHLYVSSPARPPTPRLSLSCSDMLWSETFSAIVFAPDTFCCGPAMQLQLQLQLQL